MKINYFLALLIMGGSLGATPIFERYKKAVNAYAQARNTTNIELLERAYNELMESPRALRGEKLAAEGYFKQRTREPALLPVFERARSVPSVPTVIEPAEDTKLQEEIERLKIELGIEQKSVQELEVSAEALRKTLQEQQRLMRERPALDTTLFAKKYDEIRRVLRTFAQDIDPATLPAETQQRIDIVLAAYDRAKEFSKLTGKKQDVALRQKIAKTLWRLFGVYAGPDGKRGDTAIKRRYQKVITDILLQEGLPERIFSDFTITQKKPEEMLD